MLPLRSSRLCLSCLRRIFQRHFTVGSSTPETGISLLTTRRLIALSGYDAPHFLQGLTTAKIPALINAQSSGPTTGFYSAFLNASGRVLHDVFIYPASHSTTYHSVNPNSDDEKPTFLIEVDAREVDRLATHLRRYKLRAKIQLRLVDPGEWAVWGVWGSQSTGANSVPFEIGCVDGRAPGMGMRVVLRGGEKPASDLGDELPVNDYDIRRITHGVAEGQSEIIRETALPLESNIDYMGGIDFRKGCYVGQELTIRTHHTGVVRKRILPVALYNPHDNPPTALSFNNTSTSASPPPGTNILKANAQGRSTGRWIRGMGNVGLALCRLEIMTDLVVGGEGERWKAGDEFSMVWEEGEAKKEVWVKAFVPEWQRGRVQVRDLYRNGNG